MDWFEDSKKSQISFIHLNWYDEIERASFAPFVHSLPSIQFVHLLRCLRRLRRCRRHCYKVCKTKWVCYKMVLHPSTCIIYRMQYHIWIAMCTIFVHLPKCFNAIFRFWFRLGICFFFLSPHRSLSLSCSLLFLFSILPVCICFSFYPFPSCNYWIAAIHLFLFFDIRLDLIPTELGSTHLSTLPHHPLIAIASTLAHSGERTLWFYPLCILVMQLV